MPMSQDELDYVKAMALLLSQLQWCAVNKAGWKYCPSCKNYKENGHRADCRIEIALKRKIGDGNKPPEAKSNG